MFNDFIDFQLKFNDVFGFLLIPIDFHGFSRIFNDFQLIFIDFIGLASVFIELH